MSSHAIDRHVGARLRALRFAREQSQANLASFLNISFQQVQKYENGANRISASKLFEISKFLDVRPGYFFEGLEGAEDGEEMPLDLRAIRMVSLISRIEDTNIKNRIYDLIKSLVD